MSNIDEPFVKVYDVQDLKAPGTAEGLNANFDAIWLALSIIRDFLNTLNSDDEEAGVSEHNLLDGDVHPDTKEATPEAGDLVHANGDGKWDRLGIGADGRFLKAVSGAPAWEPHGLVADDFPHNLLSSPHTDTVPESIAHGDVLVAKAQVTGAIDSLEFWHDGAPIRGLAGPNDPGSLDFWIDGAPIRTLLTGTVVGAPKWQRVAKGAEGTVLGIQNNEHTYLTIPGVGASGGAAARIIRSSDTTIPWNVPTPLALSEAEFDDAGFWSAGDPTRLTVPADGNYLVIGQAAAQKSVFGLLWVQLDVNGTVRAQVQHPLSNVNPAYANYDIAQVSAILQLNAGDQLRFLLWQARVTGLGTPLTVIGGSAYTWLSIAKVK